MRLVHFMAGIAGPLLVVSAALTPGLDSRDFSGTGSVGTLGAIEFYLPEGTYHHRLFGTPGCSITAGVVSARGSRDAPLSDLLHEADLWLGQNPAGLDPNPAVSFSVPRASWVNLHVRSGSNCRWAYSIMGPFPAASGMLQSPPQRTQWWVVISVAIIAVGLAVAASRRKPSQPSEHEATAIRMIDG